MDTFDKVVVSLLFLFLFFITCVLHKSTEIQINDLHGQINTLKIKTKDLQDTVKYQQDIILTNNKSFDTLTTDLYKERDISDRLYKALINRHKEM